MRKTIIIGNWKMNGSILEMQKFIKEIKSSLNDKVESGIAVPYTMLASLKESSKDLDFRVCAQNMHYEDKGAFTGELSSDMLLEVGVDTVIIGHSERRTYYNETDESVNLKIKKALSKNLLPIVCVGETLEEREANKQEEKCKTQIIKAFDNIDASHAEKVVVAYEPIWAIGTGKTASSSDAEQMAAYIRKVLADIYTAEVASKIRIQYGGSVKPSNVREIISQENIDGALVGGASLKSEDFVELIK